MGLVRVRRARRRTGNIRIGRERQTNDGFRDVRRDIYSPILIAYSYESNPD